MSATVLAQQLPGHTLGFIGGLGTPEIVFIIFIVFLLFGAKKIPELMRSLGRAQGEFNKAKQEFEREVKTTEAKAEDKGASDASSAADTSAPADLEQAQARAKELGIETEGKDLDTLKREIADKVISS